MAVKKIQHIGICCKSLDDYIQMLKEVFGEAAQIHGDRLICEMEGQNEALVKLGTKDDYMCLVLMESSGEGVVKKYIDKYGEGMHNIGILVDGIADTLAYLETNSDVETFGWDGATDGAAFTLPKTSGGILYEIAQDLDTDRDTEGVNARMHEEYLAYLREQGKAAQE